jgi:hypothetical protein
VHIKNLYDEDALFWSLHSNIKTTTCVLLCCGADAKHFKISSIVTQAKVDAAIAEYKSVQDFIENSTLLTPTISDEV